MKHINQITEQKGKSVPGRFRNKREIRLCQSPVSRSVILMTVALAPAVIASDVAAQSAWNIATVYFSKNCISSALLNLPAAKATFDSADSVA